MTRSEVQGLLERDPAESNADYRLIVKQGDSSVEFHMNTAELMIFTRQLQRVVPDCQLDG